MRFFLTLLATTVFFLSPALSASAAEISFVPVPERDNKAEVKDHISAYATAAKLPGVTAYTFDGTWELMQSPNEPMTQILIGAADAAKTTALPASLTLGLVDATGRTVPKNLSRGRWGSPQMLIDIDLWFRNVSRVTGDNVKWVSLGRDTDVYFANNESELEDFLSFYKKAALSARRVFPNAKIGLTITHEGLTGARKDIAQKIMSASDAAFISYYPVTAEYTFKDEDTIKADLASLGDGSVTKPVVLKEFGYPSTVGNKDTSNAQAKFFEIALPELKNSAMVELVTISDLHDHTVPTCRQEQNALKIKERGYLAFCSSLGLRESGGKKKPAWKIVETLLQPTTIPSAQ